jgi:predicted nucleotidyltransferase
LTYKSKYTVYGDKIDALIDGHLELIDKGVVSIAGDDLEAVILCGGYGRGEGGVFVGEDGSENLYNDYDMMVIVKPVSRVKKTRYKKELTILGEILGRQFGIDVDFGPLKTVSQLKNAEFTLFNYEFKYGHIVTWGPGDILDAMPEYDGSNIDVFEAVKLLLNRGVGLMLSEQKLAAGELSEADNEFVTRNIYKAIMAIGDSLLMCEGIYHWSYVKRLELMKSISSRQGVKEAGIYEGYLDSIEYKLRPKRNIFDEKQLAAMLEEVKESLMRMFYITAAKAYPDRNADDYRMFGEKIFDSGCLCAIAKNKLLNLKSFGLGGINFRWFFKYPRERLFFCLPYFLDCDDKPSQSEVCKALAVRGEENPRDKFIEIWERFG